MNRQQLSVKEKISFYRYDLFVGLAILILSLFISALTFGQGIGVNNPVPHNKALLDLTATDKGFLVPRITFAQRIAMFPAADATAKAMLIYQTDGTPGFYYYDGAQWQYLTNTNFAWTLGGNLGTNPAVNYIGSADPQDVVMKANASEVMRMKPGNKLQLGSANFTPSYAFARLSIADANGNNSDINIRVAAGSYSQIVFDQSNGTLAAPTASAVGQWSGVIVGRSYDGAGFANTSSIIFGIDSAVSVGNMRSNIMFQTSGGSQAEKMRINRYGNVGIGLVNPITRLEVANNDSGWTTSSFKNTNGKGWSGLWFLSSAGVISGHIGYGNPGAPRWADAVYAGSTAAIPFILTTTDFERARIDAAGNMGIGQNNPVQRLDVNGNVNLGNDTNNIRVNNVRAFSVNGTGNLFAGETAGILNTAANNTFIGHASGSSTVAGPNNTFVGYNSGLSNAAGFANTYVGANAGSANQNSGENAFIGYNSGMACVSGKNVFAGAYSGVNTTTGYSNVIIGDSAGAANTIGDNNIFIGDGADAAVGNLKNAIAIGSNAIVAANNSMVLGGTGASAVKVGIGVIAPTAELEVNGYTKLGTNSPAIKTIKYTSTSAATQGGNISIVHGLNAGKILSVKIMVEYALGNFVPDGYNYNPGYECTYFISAVSIVVANINANSANILSKPIKVFVTYEQ